MDAELETLREHDKRLPTLVDNARNMTRRTIADLTKIKEDNQEKARQVAAALRSRNRWREQLDAVLGEHYAIKPGSCGCGSKRCNVPEIIDRVIEEQRERGFDVGGY